MRTALWFQGCSIGCSGCFNPATHSFNPNQLIDPKVLATEIISESSSIEGITVTGGEPFDQAPALKVLLEQIRSASGLSIIVLSGYPYSKLMKKKLNREILKLTDVLISGPFIKHRRSAQNLAGSSNKIFHFFTSAYSMQDFLKVPGAELIIRPDGSVIFSGITTIQQEL